MNSINVIGRLTKDPELRKTEDGKSICNFSLAIDDTHAKEDRADFIRVTVFGVQGENCEKYLKKGFLAGVNGRIRSDTYTDADGVPQMNNPNHLPIVLIGDAFGFSVFLE